jgi:hypothetical protein
VKPRTSFQFQEHVNAVKRDTVSLLKQSMSLCSTSVKFKAGTFSLRTKTLSFAGWVAAPEVTGIEVPELPVKMVKACRPSSRTAKRNF